MVVGLPEESGASEKEEAGLFSRSDLEGIHSCD